MSAPHSAAAHQRARELYTRTYISEPTLLVRAPGRVNLIGEHTDYNDGFVLPMALPFDVVIALGARTDRTINAVSEGFESTQFSIDDDPRKTPSWGRYVHGMASLMHLDGHAVAGWNGAIATDIPTGAALSSSAALEIAAGLATSTVAGDTLDGAILARLGQRVENELLGLPSGIMDQLASASGIKGCASMIDCRDLSITPVALCKDAQVVILDTGTRRELVDSEFAIRQQDCQDAAAAIGVKSLRDATHDDLQKLDDQRLLRRARHVISANERVLEAVKVIQANDSHRLGALMTASHASLRDDYDVSSPALDAIVELAETQPGCLGARMTGGGFAGCAVALVHDHAIDTFVQSMSDAYRAPAEQPAKAPTGIWPVAPAPGASIIN